MLTLKSRIYLITDERLLLRKTFIKKIEEAASAGAGIIQLREKNSGIYDRLDLARELVRTAHRKGIKIIINDDPWLAAAIKADGVHLGQSDAAVETARELLGPKAIIGVSCYGDIERAVEMEKKGVSYVSFGACFRSPTKPKEALVPLSIFGRARSSLKIPLVAIGGIDAGNARQVVEAGADIISVVSSVFSRKRTAEAVKNLKLATGDK